MTVLLFSTCEKIGIEICVCNYRYVVWYKGETNMVNFERYPKHVFKLEPQKANSHPGEKTTVEDRYHPKIL